MAKAQTDKFLELVKKYLDGSASEDEKNLVERFYAHFAKEPDITEQLTGNELEELDNHLRYRVSNKIKRAEKPVIHLYRGKHFQMAAAILIFVSFGLWYFTLGGYKKDTNKLTVHSAKHDFNPGGNKAILVLANGSKLILDQTKDGSLAKQPGAIVTKTDSLLSYKATSKTTELSYNTITIPKGGQYQLILADGTKVWLNAASSLRFPTAFPGKERTVELTGEAYFEVAKDASKPFNVKTASQTIQVLGTHFNINAYSDENAVKTTLLEGSVKVFLTNSPAASEKAGVRLKPGEQSILNSNGSLEVKNNIDTDEITAWKNGIFQFSDADIQTIMRQISRWYDVDVEFNKAIPATTYHGRISRNSNASQVLNILEISGINFTIKGRKIIVE